jgi:hypothetical protein
MFDTSYRVPVIAGWSSLAARKAHNLEVPGSNPGPATTQGGSMSLLFFRRNMAAKTNSQAHSDTVAYNRSAVLFRLSAAFCNL